MTEIMSAVGPARVERERAFHDARFAKNPGRRWSLSGMLNAITLDAVYSTYHAARPFCEGATVLDYGCSQGEAAMILRGYGAARVEGIDISPVAIAQAAQAAQTRGIENVEFRVMDAQTLDFEAGRFDLVFGIGILHHLDLMKATGEIARVLKPTGAAVFLEPLGHNPAINLVRRLTPRLRTVDERPLRMADVRALSRRFARIESQYVNLGALLSAPFSHLPGGGWLRRRLAAADRAAFRIAPFCRRYAWNVVLTLREPRPENAA